MTKKTVISLAVLYAAVIIIMLALIPVDRKNQLYQEFGALAVRAETDERAAFAIENRELYPDYWFGLLYDDATFEMAYNYPFKKNSYQNLVYTDEELGGVPALYMDDERWIYEDYGVRIQGCAAVAVTMAYIGVRHDSQLDPIKVVNYANEMGWCSLGGIRQENISDILTYFGMSAEEHFFDCDNGESVTEAELKAALDRENSVVMAAVHGRTFGNHALIIRGYDEKGFYINDPANPENTAKVWDFSLFENELSYYWVIS